MRYEIILAPEAVEDLQRLKPHIRATVRDALEQFLRHWSGGGRKWTQLTTFVVASDSARVFAGDRKGWLWGWSFGSGTLDFQRQLHVGPVAGLVIWIESLMLPWFPWVLGMVA